MATARSRRYRFLLIPLLAVIVTVSHAGPRRLSTGAQITPVSSSYLVNSVTLDARVTTSSEWAEVTPVDLEMLKWHVGPEKVTGRWWLKNDDVWLYLLARIPWSAQDVDDYDGAQVDYFWPTGSCCPWDHSDLGFAGVDGGVFDAYGWDDASWANDITSGGSVDVEGEGRHDGTYYWFEFRKRLDSGDGFDWALRPGQLVGTGYGGDLLLGFWDNSRAEVWEHYVAIQLGAAREVRVYLPVILRAYSRVAPTPSPTTTAIVTPAPIPDVIYHNGRLLTMEGQDWEAQAMAVRGELIQAVGSNAQVLALQGPSTTVIDLQGLCLMPGFVDPHSHLFNDSYRMNMTWEESQQDALAHGITTAANMYCDGSFVRDMQRFENDGLLKIRTSMYLLVTDVAGRLQGDWWKAYPPTRDWGERLRVGGLKAFSDGGAEGCPAFTFEDPVCGYGDLWLTQQQMNTVVRDAQNAGYQMAIHALGDRSLDQVLDAYETVLQGGPSTLRHRIEHNSVVRDDQLTRYSDLGLVATLFGGYPCGAWTPPPESTRPWRWRWSDLLVANSGVHFAWHSDTPWVGPPNDPLGHLFSLVSSKEMDWERTVCDTPTWLAQKTLTLQQALPMMTIEAAYALFRETEVGSLKVGKLADYIILSDSPMSVSPEQMKDLQVLATVIAGVTEHCQSGYERLCP